MEELKKLDFEAAEAEKDVLRPVENAASKGQVGVLEGLRLIFTKEYRLQKCLAVFVLSFIQLSGIDGVLCVYRPPCNGMRLLIQPYSMLRQSSRKQESHLRQHLSLRPASPSFLCSPSAFPPRSSRTNGVVAPLRSTAESSFREP